MWRRHRYGEKLATLDQGLAELSKPLGLPHQVQEAGGSRGPTRWEGTQLKLSVWRSPTYQTLVDALGRSGLTQALRHQTGSQFK